MTEQLPKTINALEQPKQKKWIDHFKEGFHNGRRFIRIAIMIAIFLHFFSLSLIPTGSMAETIVPNDLVVFRKTENIQNGDIIIFKNPNGSENYVKRIIAMEGDSLSIQGSVVYVNGEELHEPYVMENWHTELSETVIPDGMAFVMGDNRNYSYDSRDFGYIEISSIKGKGIFILLPFHRIGGLN